MWRILYVWIQNFLSYLEFKIDEVKCDFEEVGVILGKLSDVGVEAKECIRD